MNTVDGIKIADFGLAKKMRPYATTKVVTMWYRAPELFFGMKNYTTKIDVWSVGCIAAEMLMKRPLFGTCNNETSEVRKMFDIMGTPDANDWERDCL